MNNYKPLISILIASYNAADYIEETLNSCINQTYKNIEIIISDDHSTDDSLEKIHKWKLSNDIVRPDIRCVIIASSINYGITVNFDNALQQAKGDWIKCLGSDDILTPSAIEKFVEHISKDQKYLDTGAVFTSFETFGETVSVPSVYPLAWTKMVIKSKSPYLKKQLAMLHFNNVAPGAFINKRFIDCFDTSYKMLEDLPFWLKLIEQGTGTLLFDFISVKYRIHSQQITSNNNHKLNNILLADLNKVNDFRLANHYYLAFMHHKFNLYCSSKRSIYYKYLKIINPINLAIRLFETIKK